MDEDRNTTGIYGDHREAPYEMTRDARLQLLTKMALTDNTKNTVKEDLILETVENFRAQYVALYPTRAPLLLSPQNEYGCRKFISTFIRPSQLKFDELYDWYTVAKYIANYVHYEELTEPATFPTSVTSPTTTIQWQVGNCVEMAILLASLLIGDGYDAYVCLGYAKKSVCLNDLSATPWPDALLVEVNPDDIVIEKPKPASDYVQYLKERPKLISQFDEAERKQGGNMYKVLTDEDNSTEGQDTSGIGNDNNANSHDENRLVHAWVMVKPDRRSLARPDANLFARLHLQTTIPFLGIPSTTIFHESVLPNVGGRSKNQNQGVSAATGGAKDTSGGSNKKIEEPIFIEPATGMYVRVSDELAAQKYEGIEAIFNKENYFVNMCPELPVNKLTTDLKDLSAWERIFLSDPNINSAADEETLKSGGGGGRLGATVSGALGSTTKGLGATTAGSLNNTVAALAATAGTSLGGGGGMLEPTSTVGESGDQTLDLQLTWLPPITLTLAQYANRYPDRQKVIVYAGVTVELFAEYSEPDLKVLVVTIDEEASARHGLGRGREVHTFYKHRSDRMRRKSVYPSGGPEEDIKKIFGGINKINNNNKNISNILDKFKFSSPAGAPYTSHHGVSGGGAGGRYGAPSAATAALIGAVSYVTHYWFEPGRMQEGSHRVEGLRELIIEPGIHRTMRFFWKSRDDGLATRIERFAPNSRNTPSKVKEYYKGRGEDFLVYRSARYDLPREGGGGLGVAALSSMSSKDHRHDPIKMSEKFARNLSAHIDSDVEKRVYTKPQSNDGEIWTKYHYRPGCITRGIRLYPKNFDREKDLTAAAMIAKDQGRDAALDVQPYVVLMPEMEKPKDTDLLNELRVLVDKENECLNEIRARADDCRDILAHLNLDREDQNGLRGGDGYGKPKSSGSSDKDKNQRDTALVSIFDTLRGRAKESEAEIAQRKAEEQRRAESRKDYLAPFIAKQENMAKICKGDYTNAKLSLEMARKVRDEAIADLKERLIERGHIMQTRLDREREDLMRRQMAFQKAIDGSDGTKESEEFSRYGKEATWRIRILEERLSNYIKSSADKYRQLADKLANDKRLAALYATGEQR